METKPKKPFYKRWWFIAIVVFFALGVIGSMLDDSGGPSGSTGAPQNVNSSKEPELETIKVSAQQLYAEYKENEVAADQKYKGKTLEISGTINNIGKDIIDNPYITLDVDELIASVQCSFKKSEEDVVANLKKGQEVIVIGKGNGFLLNVQVKDSKIKE